ncbi:hypothetical protein [Priestia flexa]|uniref:Uncharacterized protein n=1 Tax=Priestia flexa TaxID=86664 RepID=A0ABU4J286_9BACI|nr:hypothetical protein [Priestia flexa]MDW8515106.1 hypothetical protein [Priestia flexa]
MKQSIPEEEREEKRKREAYEKHKCKGCIWSTWQKEQIVLCLFPRCVKGDGR